MGRRGITNPVPPPAPIWSTPYSVGFVMLRDHTLKCDHGFYLSHYWNSYVGECPGGRAVTDNDEEDV